MNFIVIGGGFFGLYLAELMWGTKNGPLGLVEKGLKSSTF